MNHLKAYEKASYSLVATPKPGYFSLQLYLHLGIELPNGHKGDKLSGIFMGTGLTVNETGTYSSNTDFVDGFSYISFDKFQENYIRQNNKNDNIVVFNQILSTTKDDLMTHFQLAKKDLISKLRVQVQEHDQLVLNALDNTYPYSCQINFTWFKKHIKEFELKIPKLSMEKTSIMTYKEIMAIKREQFLNYELTNFNNKSIHKI